MNRNDLQALSRLRLKEAKTLLDRRMPSGVYYLAGYAVECALKACIAKQTRRYDFPLEPSKARDIYVHDPSKLVVAAGLRIALDAARQADPDLDVAWTIAKDWSERSRYEQHLMAKAVDMYDAVSGPAPGVLQWLRQYW